MLNKGFIGVVCRDGERPWVQEFFELFKTPWEFYRPDGSYRVVLSTGDRPENLKCDLLLLYSSAPSDECGRLLVSDGQEFFVEYENFKIPLYGRVAALSSSDTPLLRLSGSTIVIGVVSRPPAFKVIRAGYDLFNEIAFLLTAGQPRQNAHIPTVDLHIAMLRQWILRAGIPVVEIPPSPLGYDFIGCLTHDVDFVRITDHKLDHTTLGFLKRATAGSFLKAMNKEMSWSSFFQNASAAVRLPAVYLGLCDDFWLKDFDRFLDIERETKATFFFIPFKGRSGEKVESPHSDRRAAAYDVAEERQLIEKLADAGNEIGVHGLDAWHNAEKGREERRRITDVSGNSNPGVRMHWLCFNASSPRILEAAGYPYDSTIGYNDAAGYRAGTSQVFRPDGATTLLELPLHIQDSALFYDGRLGLNQGVAWKLCESIVSNASTYGGALTILWHTRSLAPERQWGGFYTRLLDRVRKQNVWFATASQAVRWFRKRRTTTFQNVEYSDSHVRITLEGRTEASPDIAVRLHTSSRAFHDIPFTGQRVLDLPLR